MRGSKWLDSAVCCPFSRWKGLRSAESAAAIATLGIAAILVTPYCGLLFGCGCTWPWSGLAARCSFFQPEATIVCPWCEHAFAGTASVLLSAAAGTLLAAKIGLGRSLSQRSAIIVRILIGTAVFLLVALIAGWITATATGYPGFLMSTPSLASQY